MRKFNKLSSSPKLSLKETTYKFLFEQGEEEEKGKEEDKKDEEDSEEGDDKDKKEDDKKKPSAEESLENIAAVDAEMTEYLVKAEKKARTSAEVNKSAAEMHLESRSLRFLLEDSSDDDVDLNVFASEVARFVDNYQNLIDWKTVILNKVESFITSHYDEDTAKRVLDILEQDYGITKHEGQETPSEVPIAVGATGSGGGG